MAEYINRDECRDKFYASVLNILSGDSTNDRANQIIDEFDNLPATDVEPVKQGVWCTKYRSGTPIAKGMVSSCCDMWNERQTAFCPHCGAKMKGEENGK